MTTIGVVVPWRYKGDPWRLANFTTVRYHLDGFAPVVVASDGLAGDTPFNRSRAYNLGAAQLPEADVIVFHEADMLIPRAQLVIAVNAALVKPGMVVPFDTYDYLSPEDTSKVRAGADPQFCTPEFVMADGRSNGAVNVVSRSTLEAVGGWDENFSGWGFDDRAMARAFEITSSSPTRYIQGHGVHLWHRPGWSVESRFRGGSEIPPEEHYATVRNEARYRRYRQARTAADIRALTNE